MTDFVRRLVSGGKARFKDENLDLDLDLVYVTDQVIIMGYPANGVEGLYRNRREDAKKFLDHHHGKNYWIFNFCPIRENSYDKSYFEGRVSRYPFPDHHAPPLAILPLVAREVGVWLDSSKDRVVVLHCKAGKGRSGTLACAYLLAARYNAPIHKTANSVAAKELAKELANEQMDAIPKDDEAKADTLVAKRPNPLSSSTSTHKSSILHEILDLHTSRRMRPASPTSEQKNGVSIPSQRRSFWSSSREPTRKIKVTGIRVDIRESSTLKMQLVRAANTLIQTTGQAASHTVSKNGTLKGQHMWVSLARYNDAFVKELEKWERSTRDEENLGKLGGEPRESMFQDGTWDAKKMVRSFARMSAEEVELEDQNKKEKLHRYVYKPVSSANWTDLHQAITAETPSALQSETQVDAAASTTTLSDLSSPKNLNDEGTIVLDANREVRVKLYLGQIFLTWMWFVPAFHLTPENPSTTLVLSKEGKELDFPLGVGSGIVDVAIDFEWMDWKTKQEPASLPTSKSPSLDAGQTGLGAAVQAVMEGDVREVAIAKQAVEN